MANQTIYEKYFCDDELGECQGFFDFVDKKLHCISAWSSNDADYRGEYMQPVFNYLGVNVQQLPKKHDKAAIKLLKERWGF